VRPGPARRAQATIPGTYVAQPPTTETALTAEDDIMDKIRRLGELHQAGIVTDEEFTTKKAELLGRL
jgi:hypothetical protein